MNTTEERPSESDSGQRQRVTLVVVIDCDVADVAAAHLAAPRVAQLVRHRALDALGDVVAGPAVATVAECSAKEFVSAMGAAVARANVVTSEKL